MPAPAGRFLRIAVSLVAFTLSAQDLQRAIGDIRAGRLAEAEQTLTGIVKREPGSADAHYYLGVLHFRAGRPERAVEWLLKAAQLAPARAAVWKALGASYAAQGQFPLAEGPFRKACDLDAREELACYYLGRNLYAQNRFEPAVAAFEKALGGERAGNLWLAHRGLAQALEALGRDDAAEKHFREAIRLAGDKARPDEDPRIDYGIFLQRQGRTEEARRPLEDAVKSFPASSRARFELGRVLAQINLLEPAVEHLRKAVETDPKNWPAHLLLGKVYLRLGRTEEGERHLKTGEQGATAEGR